ncbi:hypothetical protein Ahy_A01g000677 [Arachis hypogaea]|uniref:Aminotransferase-like plant mobile domain-containing protein n=1 Tax=Arachis hypogaea TaxID=3818 RepID=A0A445EL76_ARAHY|nr:hypothetical protein Ahy_A01g000677 [Arachis hypogaea]
MYRLDHVEHIVGRLDRVAPRILRTRQNLMTRSPEYIRQYLRRVKGQTVTDKVDCEAHLVPQHGLWRARAGCHKGAPDELIGGILYPDASDSRVHIRWLPLLEDIDACGRLSWGLAMLAWQYRQKCRATEHGQHNLGECVSLILFWAYHRILLVWPDGFDARRFSLVERWVQYRPGNATGKSRLRQYRRMLNGIGIDAECK